jgi:hypothetical protein
MDIEGYEYYVLQGMKKTMKQKSLRAMFIELHPPRIGIKRTKELLQAIKSYGFKIDYVISRDKAVRRIIGETKVETLSIQQLIADPRLRNGEMGFQIFFTRS